MSQKYARTLKGESLELFSLKSFLIMFVTLAAYVLRLFTNILRLFSSVQMMTFGCFTLQYIWPFPSVFPGTLPAPARCPPPPRPCAPLPFLLGIAELERAQWTWMK